MTKIEKGIIWGMVACIGMIVVSVFTVSKSIKDAGGVKAVIVEAGKEVKDIARQIKED